MRTPLRGVRLILHMLLVMALFVVPANVQAGIQQTDDSAISFTPAPFWQQTLGNGLDFAVEDLEIRVKNSGDTFYAGELIGYLTPDYASDYPTGYGIPPIERYSFYNYGSSTLSGFDGKVRLIIPPDRSLPLSSFPLNPNRYYKYSINGGDSSRAFQVYGSASDTYSNGKAYYSYSSSCVSPLFNPEGACELGTNNGIADIFFQFGTAETLSGTETAVTTEITRQEGAVIDGDIIAWMENSNMGVPNDIYAYEISTGRKIRITNDGTMKGDLMLAGRKILWTTNDNSYERATFIYDLDTATTTEITANVGTHVVPTDFDGQRIVLQAGYMSPSSIYLYDLATSQLTIIDSDDANTQGSSVSNPKISGNKILYKWIGGWSSFWCRENGLRLYDIATGGKTLIFNGFACGGAGDYAIDGDNIIATFASGSNNPQSISQYKISTGEGTFTSSSFRQITGIDISGDIVVWSDTYDIFMYDLATGKTGRTGMASKESLYPKVSGDTVVWEDYRAGGRFESHNIDIYMYQIMPTPPPSSGGGGGGSSTNHQPIVTLNGDNPMSLSVGDTFIDPGATATDDIDGDLTMLVVWSNTVDTSVVGSYTVTYSVTDSGGLTGVTTRTVTVNPVPPTQPVFGHSICDVGDLSAKNLIFITHGWNSNADGWVFDMAVSIAKYRNQHHLTNTDWAICTYNWHEDAQIPDPRDAYNNARIQGEILGQLLAKNDYTSVHFIAHSAGSNLIQTASEFLKSSSPDTRIQLTFLDGYDPNGNSSTYGRDPRNQNGQYTIYPDWWAEQYVDMRGASFHLLDETNIILKDAYNFDITNLDTSGTINPLDFHSWPYSWYQQSIADSLSQDDPAAKYGFPLSQESGKENILPIARFLPGGCKKLAVGNAEANCSTQEYPLRYDRQYAPVLAVADIAAHGAVDQSTTGTISYPDATTVIGTLSSPVWFRIHATTTTEANILRFDYQFLSVPRSEDILTVFVDGQAVYKIDERITAPGSHTAMEIPTGDLPPGSHTIEFRTDPFSDAKSPTKISNIQFGFLTSITVTDILAPTTTISVSGTLWKNDWYLGTTTMMFTAQDNPGGVGVAKTEYSFDDGLTWNNYVASSSVATASEGTTTVSYRSVDFFGNTEPTNMLVIKIVSAKWFLEDVLVKLGVIQTENRDIDRATDSVESILAKIIADKSWLDRNSLAWPKGISVIKSEVKVVKALNSILNKAGQKKDNTSAAMQGLYRDAQNEIVQSSALLAKLSFDKAKLVRAKNSAGQKALDKLIIRIQKMQDRAVANESNNPSKASQLYGAVWFSSEALLKSFGAVPIHASDLDELYDSETMKDLMD
ncbi:MAG: DUF5011 domain-containing protein [bacterium]|nr:DUF5011 domain-containing protein [bacterium]